jgi:hypothetical protein
MYVGYKDDRFQYVCQAARSRYGLPSCQFLSGGPIDTVVVEEFFAVLKPAAIDALERVSANQASHHAEVIRHLEQDVQRLEYAAARAQRQYDRVDPDNRLIAATLEKRWEAALAELEQARGRLADAQARSPRPAAIPADLRAAFTDVGRRLPEVWPRLSNEARKDLLRTLVAGVNLTRGDGGVAVVRVVWSGGLVSERAVRVPVSSLRYSTRERQVIDRIRRLAADGGTDDTIASRLNDETLAPCRGGAFTAGIVRKLRGRSGIRIGLGRLRAGERPPGYTTAEVARRIGVDVAWFSRAIAQGRLVVPRSRHFGCYLFPRVRDTIVKLKALKAGTLRQVSFPEVHTDG